MTGPQFDGLLDQIQFLDHVSACMLNYNPDVVIVVILNRADLEIRIVQLTLEFV